MIYSKTIAGKTSCCGKTSAGKTRAVDTVGMAGRLLAIDYVRTEAL